MEKDFQDYIIKVMRQNKFMVNHHTEKWVEGIADISFSGRTLDGWIEFKWLAKRPHPSKPFFLRNFTSQQVYFLQQKGKTGSGLAFLFLRVGDSEYYLWSWPYVHNLCKETMLEEYPTWLEAIDNCRMIMTSDFDIRHFLKVITGFNGG